MMTKKQTMKITILGSGTCVPSLRRYPSSVLVQIESFTILFDIGPGIIGQLLKVGVQINDIDMICLSHFHLDHCADLAPFIFATKYPRFERSKKLTLAGGIGVKTLFSNLNNAYANTLEMPGSQFEILDLSEKENQRRMEQSLQLTWAEVVHKPESLAYRFSDPSGFSFVYSGDTDYSQGLIDLAKGADLMVCESAMPDDKKVSGHLTPSEAGRMARNAAVKKLVLTHFYPECDGVDMKAQCEEAYEGPVVLARDLMSF